MQPAPLTTAVFDDLIAALGEIRDSYVLDPDRFVDANEVAEAYRYVGQVLSAASELFVEADPEHPRFASIVSPARKIQGDNPDAIYHFTRVRGDVAYRISGHIRQECYTSFTIHGRAADGGLAGPLLGDVNDRQFEVADDGTYSLVLSATEQPGNWLRLDPAAHAIVVRSYFALDPSAQNDPAVSVEIDIRALGIDGPSAPLSDAVLAERMAEAVAFVRQATIGQTKFGMGNPVPFVATEPNTLPTPFSFRASGLPVPGAADIHYSSGRFVLQPDEALVMTGTLPPGPFANVMLWNAHMQTLEYRTRRSSLNQRQIVLEADGSFRVVVAHRDPGVPNWLDCEGHGRGTIFWRLLLAEADPTPIVCTVVPVDSLRA